MIAPMNSPVALFILFVVVYFILKNHVLKEQFLPVFTYLIGTANKLYKLLEIIQTLFEKNGIPFSISGRILLQAVMNQKLSRGDSVGLILVPKESIKKVLDLHEDFLQLGLGFNDLPDGSIRLGAAMKLPFISDISIQILPVELAGDKWIVSATTAGYDEWYGATELFPTKLYRLGELDLPGPADAVPYLQRNYWSRGLAINKENMQLPLVSVMYTVPKVSTSNGRMHDYNYTNNVLINGLMKDPRLQTYPSYGKQSVILGNGNARMIPTVSTAKPRSVFGRWRKYLWSN